MDNQEIIKRLHDIGAIKFGSFTLKSGILSPIYIDLRLIISYPDLLDSISDALWEKAKNLQFDLLCGVPYTALPIATCISVKHNVPMIMRRKEVKQHGTKRILEGKFSEGQTCLLVEDLITSGLSIIETAGPIKQEGLTIKDIVLVIDREQGGTARLESKGYKVHSLFTIGEMMDILILQERIDAITASRVKLFIEENQLQLV